MPLDERWRILDLAPDATLVTDGTGVVVYANQKTEEMLGWPPDELIGQHLEVLIPPELRERHRMHHAGYQDGPKPRMMGLGLELSAQRRNGTTIPVEIALSPIGRGAEMVVLASIRDISDRVRMQDQLHETATRLAVVDERDRIARDLHDRVIQRLFASGLHLQAALGRDDQDERVAEVIDEIDEAIKEIRTTIFTMHSPRGLNAGFEPALRTAVAEASRVLGHHPRLEARGVLSLVPADVAAEAIDVVRELLTNVAKHARAATSTVVVEVTDHLLTLMVRDDGIGFDAARVGPGHGVRNIEERASGRRGAATFEQGEPHGTVATWTVPLG